MPPRKIPRVCPPGNPQGSPWSAPEVTKTSVETPNPEGAPGATNANPSFQMDPTLMQTLLAHRIAIALAAYEAARNDNIGNSRNGGGIQVNSQNNSWTCSYKEFIGCKPRSFYGMEIVVGLSCWTENMEAVFHISYYPDDYRVRYTTCILMDSSLTWWNNHAPSMGINEAYFMGWEPLKQMMIKGYCLRQEV